MKFHHGGMWRAVAALALAVESARAQAPDPGLLAAIRGIRAIDNHSHPPALVAAGQRDDEFDALPCDPLEPTQPALSSRPDNPRFLAAWKALYGYKYNDADSNHLRELLAEKQRAKAAQGDHYPSWVLDKLGIETELANRVAIGRGLDAPRFRWVPFVDALLFPLDNSPIAAQTPDRKFFMSREDMLRARYMRDLGISAIPATLGEYLARVVTPTLERQRQSGAVAIKFEVAYLRSLDFGPSAEADAATIYARYAGGSAPDTAQYRRLQNFLFRYIASESGRIGMAVHVHTGAGCGSYFSLSGANPMLLEPVLNDPALRKTNFVLLHAGAVAYAQTIGYLVMKPNVYADFSQLTWMESAQHLGASLRNWLEWYPEKILFGTDLAPGGFPGIDWEEIAWQTTDNARRALGIALTGMMRDGEISRAEAVAFARNVLHDNAAKLYGITAAPTP